MNKKIILLMLALPLILMLSLFTATSTVSLMVPIAVTGLEINDLDQGTKSMYLGESYEISYTVYPTNAANQDVIYSTEPTADGAKFADLEITDGTITPRSDGSAIVWVETVDGGIKQKFTVYVNLRPDSLTALTASVDKTTIALGESARILVGYAPENVNANQKSIAYQVIDGADVVSVDAAGNVVANKGKEGTATVRVASLVNTSIMTDVTVTVESKMPVSFWMGDVDPTIKDSKEGKEMHIPLFVREGVTIDPADVDIEIVKNDTTATTVEYRLELENKQLVYWFVGDDVCDVTVIISMQVDGEPEPVVSQCGIKRVSEILEAYWKNVSDDAIMIAPDSSYTLGFTMIPSTANVTYTVTVQGEGAEYLTTSLNGQELTVTAAAGSEIVELTVVLTITDVNNPENSVRLTQRFLIWG